MSQKCDCPKRNRWYFGGLSAVMASCITHPIDTVKVQLQTHQYEKQTILKLTQIIIHEGGIFGFYNGLSAAILRQMTATQTRISLYESGKNYLNIESLSSRLLLASGAGAIGGIVGMPAAIVTIHMQNDIKLPPELRKNYRNAFDGFKRIYHEEGFRGFFVGGTVAIARLIFLTIGQNVIYDQAKYLILKLPHFTDDVRTHFSASIVAAIFATIMTHPLDVIATRAISSKRGENKSIIDVIFRTAQEGPMVFYKGFLPACLRLGPHTILILLFMEQLRRHFGYTAKSSRCCGPELL